MYSGDGRQEFPDGFRPPQSAISSPSPGSTSCGSFYRGDVDFSPHVAFSLGELLFTCRSFAVANSGLSSGFFGVCVWGGDSPILFLSEFFGRLLRFIGFFDGESFFTLVLRGIAWVGRRFAAIAGAGGGFAPECEFSEPTCDFALLGMQRGEFPRSEL